MPRLSALRTRALAELARQLRFESADAARRQLMRAEQLAVELLEGGAEKDAAPAFPEEWVVFRITGLRTESALAGGEAVMLVREAVIADLGPLVERLSSAAGIEEKDLPAKAGKGGALGGPGSDVAAVCERWRVSRKTLERYRRMGLIGRRVRLGKGKERVVFSEDVLRLFERVHGLRVRGAAEFSRISKDERVAMIDAARAMRAEKGWTLDRCARVLAKEHGRAVSLEVRPPLLDHRLVELALRFDARLLRRGAEDKWILRRSLAGRVPEEILGREKQGFSMPVRRWARAMPGLAADAQRRLARAGILRSAGPRRLGGEQLWSLLVLDRWSRHAGIA